MGLDLYCMLPSPPSRAVFMCAHALGLQLNKINIDLRQKEHLDPKFVKVNPQHTIPTLVDDGFVIWDSHAITAYLVEKFGKDDTLYPKDLQKRAIVDQRLHFDSGNLFPCIREFVISVLHMGEKKLSEETRQKVLRSYAFLEAFLEGDDYLAGNNFTIADICCVASVSSLVEALRVNTDDFPRVGAWLQRCRENLPGYKDLNQPGLDLFKQAVDGALN